MRLPLVALLLVACNSSPPPPPPKAKPPDPSIPKPAPVGALAAPVAGQPAPEQLAAPTGTFGVETYRARRRALMDRLNGSAAVIIQRGKWDDGAREGMDFYYLTGIDGEEGAALLLEPRARLYKETLFLPRRDVEGERWTGDRSALPSKQLEVATGIGRISRRGGLGGALLGACRRSGSLAWVGESVPPGVPVPEEMTLYREVQQRLFNCRVEDMAGLVAKMRVVKEPEELVLMRKAIDYTAEGHKAAIATVAPGMREYQVKDAIEDAFRKAGSRHVAFDSITGSGPNAAVLHYPKDDRVMKDGELIVVDIGAEAELYAADVTRTLPVGGKFTKEQREIYDVVLAAQAAGIAKARAGATIQEIDLATREVIANAGYYDFYLHTCCHYVGLQVHDSGLNDAPLPVGAVITVEPGIYLGHRGFGVRIEDQVLITAGDPEVITQRIPKDPAEIERLLQAAPK